MRRSLFTILVESERRINSWSDIDALVLEEMMRSQFWSNIWHAGCGSFRWLNIREDCITRLAESVLARWRANNTAQASIA